MVGLLTKSLSRFDQDLKRRLFGRIAERCPAVSRSIRIECDCGVVTLRGCVDKPRDRRFVAALARGTIGLHCLIDELEVTARRDLDSRHAPRYKFSPGLERYFQARRDSFNESTGF